MSLLCVTVVKETKQWETGVRRPENRIRTSSTEKEQPNNGTQSAQYNDKSYTRTKADEAADQRPSLNLTMYRSLSQTDQVTVVFIIYY